MPPFLSERIETAKTMRKAWPFAIVIIITTLISYYDLFISEFLPESYQHYFPKIYKSIGIIWFILSPQFLFGLIFIAFICFTFEHFHRERVNKNSLTPGFLLFAGTIFALSTALTTGSRDTKQADQINSKDIVQRVENLENHNHNVIFLRRLKLIIDDYSYAKDLQYSYYCLILQYDKNNFDGHNYFMAHRNLLIDRRIDEAMNFIKSDPELSAVKKPQGGPKDYEAALTGKDNSSLGQTQLQSSRLSLYEFCENYKSYQNNIQTTLEKKSEEIKRKIKDFDDNFDE